MKEYPLIKKKYFTFNWQTEETFLEWLAGFLERIWNWGLPVLAGVLSVTKSPYWLLLALVCGIFQLHLNVVKKK